MLLSYEVGTQAAFFAGGRPPARRSLLGKKGDFPTGLLPRVLQFIVDKQLQFDFKDLRRQPKASGAKIRHRVHTPYPAQTAAVEAATEAHRGCISMPTGTGKSLVIAMLAAKFGVKTLVVVPSLEIKRQLEESLQAMANHPEMIQVENIDSKALTRPTTADCLIIDEAHHVAARTYQKLNKSVWQGIYYRFFLTATPFRNKAEENLLFESIAGSLIYSLSYKEAIKEEYIVPVDAYYIEIPKTKNDYYTWAEVYSKLVVKNDIRNAHIVSLLKALHGYNKATLCLVKEVAHGKLLSEATGYPFVNGTDEESRQYIEQFNKGQIKVLIGTTGILGEGVDTKPAEFIVIAGLGKAKSAFMQQIGRGVRKYPGKDSAKIIIFKDPSHKFTTRHFNEQKKILMDEYGVEPARMEFE